MVTLAGLSASIKEAHGIANLDAKLRTFIDIDVNRRTAAVKERNLPCLDLQTPVRGP